ncbi:MAG: hypothetical protein EP301_08525 [Gammaproteobacteria bacterium]|nr:MAG: hypothetical protein EP301_08525 [Gammaproteobacteria bacterium]
MYQEILYRVEDPVATITLNRPKRLNAFTQRMGDELKHAVARAETDPAAVVIVLTGAGRGFCAGADLNQVAEGSGGDASSREEEHPYNRTLRMLNDCPVPTVARINGPAAGGGFGLALACDIGIAAHSAFFVATFGPRLGIVPDMGATWNIPRKVGRSRALGITLLGERISAEQAEEWGLIWSAVADDALDDEVARVTGILKNSSPATATRIRESIDVALDNSFDDQLALEMAHQAVLIPRNMQEGAKAFIEKREPAFSGQRDR